MHFANNDPKLPFHEELDRRSAFAYFESSSILDRKKEREKEEKRQLFERWLPRVFSKIIINFFILDWDNLKIRSACYTIFFKFHFTYLYIYIYSTIVSSKSNSRWYNFRKENSRFACQTAVYLFKRWFSSSAKIRGGRWKLREREEFPRLRPKHFRFRCRINANIPSPSFQASCDAIV